MADHYPGTSPASGRSAGARAMVMTGRTELFKQFMDNESFHRWVTDTIFGLTYEPSGAEGSIGSGR